jgi:hypothetical protein
MTFLPWSEVAAVTVGTLFDAADVVVSIISGPQLVSKIRTEAIKALTHGFIILIFHLSNEICPFYNMPAIKSIGISEKSPDKEVGL